MRGDREEKEGLASHAYPRTTLATIKVPPVVGGCPDLKNRRSAKMGAAEDWGKERGSKSCASTS